MKDTLEINVCEKENKIKSVFTDESVKETAKKICVLLYAYVQSGVHREFSRLIEENMSTNSKDYAYAIRQAINTIAEDYLEQKLLSEEEVMPVAPEMSEDEWNEVLSRPYDVEPN